MSMVKIEGKSLVRDTDNMALINTDANELQAYLNRRKILIAQAEEINTLKNDVFDMKNDLSEIKSILKEIIKDKN